MVRGTGKREKIVTVCLANRARSPTAEWLLHRDYKVKSCGTAEFDATKPCDKWDMRWATKVLVMEPYQKTNLDTRFPNETRGGKVQVLDVPEVGKYSCQPSLLTEIADRLKERGLRVRNIKDLNRASNACAEWTWRMAERKLRAKEFGAKSYQLEDFWTPHGEGEDEALGVEFGVIPKVRALEPWQIEEQQAFFRASQAHGGQGGITRPTGELSDAEIEALFKQVALENKEPEPIITPEDIEEVRESLREEIDEREAQRKKPKPWQLRADDFQIIKEIETPASNVKKQKKLMDTLKDYTDSVKEFFKS